MMIAYPLVWSTIVTVLGLSSAWLVYDWARRRVPAAQASTRSRWSYRWTTLVTYWAVSAVGHLGWELAQLPLFGLWTNGTAGQIAFATLHCTGGDLLIATAVLVLAIMLTWATEWPFRRFAIVAATIIMLGLAYTAYSEWHNVYVEQAWSYAASMPTLTLAGHAIGMTPLVQWLLVPGLALWAIRPADRIIAFEHVAR